MIMSSARGVWHRFAIAAGLVFVSVGAAWSQDEALPTFPLNRVPLDRAAAAELPPPTDERILGGDIAPAGAWPWQVALVFAGDSPSQGQFCGGTIIASLWVLTAAHCVVDEAEDQTLNLAAPDMIDVLVGTNDLAADDGERLQVAAIYTHPGYDPLRFDNDIALIKLASAPIHPEATAIPLSTLASEQRFSPTGAQAVVTGWGRLLDGRYPNELRQVQIQILDRASCNRGGGGAPEPGITITGPITENMICSGARIGTRGSCNGDSGGPLVVAIDDNRYLQVGIVSWGYEANTASGCDTSAAFDAYTRVARYQDWISETIAAN
jgi:secreted trypsin-like serine protease